MNLADPVRLERVAGWLTLDCYRPEYARQVATLTGAGFEAEGVAALFEVDVATLDRWRTDHPDFAEAMDRGAVLADVDVSAALYQAAVGHERIESRTVAGRTVTHTVHVPGDVRACMVWLERRCPEHAARGADEQRGRSGAARDRVTPHCRRCRGYRRRRARSERRPTRLRRVRSLRARARATDTADAERVRRPLPARTGVRLRLLIEWRNVTPVLRVVADEIVTSDHSGLGSLMRRTLLVATGGLDVGPVEHGLIRDRVSPESPSGFALPPRPRTESAES